MQQSKRLSAKITQFYKKRADSPIQYKMYSLDDHWVVTRLAFILMMVELIAQVDEKKGVENRYKQAITNGN